ncbi:hypothetical protein WJX72_009714 [[Myrmecia] bisecta]|uniref:Uncharacterized protein n=1 Tax=[Myrmecia] bisecta TaxID=41462 RepID=A0AAW1QSG0_9CHLO
MSTARTTRSSRYAALRVKCEEEAGVLPFNTFEVALNEMASSQEADNIVQEADETSKANAEEPGAIPSEGTAPDGKLEGEMDTEASLQGKKGSSSGAAQDMRPAAINDTSAQSSSEAASHMVSTQERSSDQSTFTVKDMAEEEDENLKAKVEAYEREITKLQWSVKLANIRLAKVLEDYKMLEGKASALEWRVRELEKTPAAVLANHKILALEMANERLRNELDSLINGYGA